MGAQRMSKLRPVGKGAIVDTRMLDIQDAIVEYTRRSDFAAEIGKLWRDAQRKFILIGRYLTRAKEVLPHGEFEEMVERDLPFGTTTAYQLRVVAATLDSGRLPAERVPPDYTTVYHLSTLSDDELRQAEDHRLIRPDVSRKEVVSFKRLLRQPVISTAALPTEIDRNILLEERHRLLARVAEIDAILSQEE